MKPPSISEEDEDAETISSGSARETAMTADDEVSRWVISAMEMRRTGRAGKGQKPALHAVPLGAIPSPSSEKADGLSSVNHTG